MAAGGKTKGDTDTDATIQALSGLHDSSNGSKKDRKKRKKKNAGQDKDISGDGDTTLDMNNTADLSNTAAKTEKKKKKRKTKEDEIAIKDTTGDVDNGTDKLCSEEETEKMKKRKRKSDDEIDDEETSPGKKDKKRKVEKDVKIPEVDPVLDEKIKEVKNKTVDKTQPLTLSSRVKNKMKSKENQSIKKLLEQRTTLGSEPQLKRIRSVCDDVSYQEVMDELLPKLKKKMKKRTDKQNAGKDRKVEKYDGKINKLKDEAIEKASELNEDAIKKLASIENAIIRKMKKKSRKKGFVINEMARDRLSKGKTGLGARCQDGIATLQYRSKEARSGIKLASKETKEILDGRLKDFTQRIRELDTSNVATDDLDAAFSGAASIKGYLC